MKKVLIVLLLLPAISIADDKIICQMDIAANYKTHGAQVGNLCERYVKLIEYTREYIAEVAEQEKEIRRLKKMIRRKK